MPSAIYQAIKQICDEKNIPVEAVVKTIEAALAAAYRKDFAEKNQNIKVEFNPETGGMRVFDIKTVVEEPEEEPSSASTDAEALADKEASEGKEEKAEEADKKKKKGRPKKSSSAKATEDKKEEIAEVKIPEAKVETGEMAEGEEKKRFNPRTDLALPEAKKLKKDAKIGDEIKTELVIPAAFGRMAAQTAKQVIIQRLREAEREALFNDFKDKEGELINGTIQRREGRLVLIDLGRTTAIMPPQEQVMRERYLPGQRIKVYVVKVSLEARGPEIIVSRAHEELIKKLFFLEIPEIQSKAIEIMSVAREAGMRSKVAVKSNQENIDPIGSCVGQRGTRIQTIISELGGEKIDIIEYSEEPAKFIANSLSPAKVVNVEIDEKNHEATAIVKEDQLSLAIGKAGQNVRLAAKLTGWKISIVKEKVTGEKEKVEVPVEAAAEEIPAAENKELEAKAEPSSAEASEGKEKKSKTKKAKKKKEAAKEEEDSKK